MTDLEPIPDSALKRLGGELAQLLDDDLWNNTEKRYLLPALEEQEVLRSKLLDAEALLTDARECRDYYKHRAEAAEAELTDWRESARVGGPAIDALRAKLQAAEKRTAALVELADDYASHDSWRCGYYDECHCGLNDLQKKAGLELSPCGYAKDTKWIRQGHQ